MYSDEYYELIYDYKYNKKDLVNLCIVNNYIISSKTNKKIKVCSKSYYKLIYVNNYYESDLLMYSNKNITKELSLITSIVDTDLLILMELDNKSLLQYCHTNKIIFEMCMSNKILRKKINTNFHEENTIIINITIDNMIETRDIIPHEFHHDRYRLSNDFRKIIKIIRIRDYIY